MADISFITDGTVVDTQVSCLKKLNTINDEKETLLVD
jgi:hypothetical protein